jgi:lipid-binding SYLF domain-containing protein
MEAFRSRVKSAKAVIIVPSLTRAALVVGGSGGDAVVLARDKTGNTWTEPAFHRVASGSLGMQLGVDVSEVVMLVMTDKALDALLSRDLVLGGDASFAVGGMGIGGSGSVTADIVSYARSKGAYAGLSLEGAAIKPDVAANEDYYGRPVSAVDVLVRREVWNPVSAPLQRSLADLSR